MLFSLTPEFSPPFVYMLSHTFCLLNFICLHMLSLKETSLPRSLDSGPEHKFPSQKQTSPFTIQPWQVTSVL